MFDTIFGLPVHSLVIHAVVVLVPLSSVAVIAMLVWPVWRERLRVPVLVLLVVGTGSAFVAKESGEALQRRVTVNSDAFRRHVDLGTVAPLFVLGFLVLYALWFWLTLPRTRVPAATPGRLRALLAVTTLVGLVTLGWIVAVGHAGSTAVWHDLVANTTPR